MSSNFTLHYDEIIAETEAAICFRSDEDDIWIPKSQIQDHDTRAKEVEIPEWLARKKGLL